jgi:hypothetical protein
MTGRCLPIAVGLAAAAAAVAMTATAAFAVPTAGAAAPRLARFDVELSGVQQTTWEKHHFSTGGCDVAIDGEGAETYRFHSRRLRVRALSTPSGLVLIGGKGPAMLPLSGTVTRSGRMTVGAGEVCSYGDGTSPPAPRAPDCGTRRVSGAVEVGFSTRPADLLVISDGELDGRDVFATCPTGASDQFPTLMTYDGRRRVGQRLPAHDLLTHGQNIVVARATKRVTNGELTSTTTIRWSASFRRVDHE